MTRVAVQQAACDLAEGTRGEVIARHRGPQAKSPFRGGYRREKVFLPQVCQHGSDGCFRQGLVVVIVLRNDLRRAALAQLPHHRHNGFFQWCELPCLCFIFFTSHHDHMPPAGV